ncbi:MAG: hypothetical protein AAF721_33095 [Myxococcota bacterium]
MKKRWRREFLEALAARGIPVEKFWLLIRVDLVDDEDLRLFGEANCGLGFGLESGDPGLLATIRKSGRLDDYLQRMEHIAERARVHDVPWGANVICGHPGETPDTLRRSAAYLKRLFVDGPGTTGFLSVDPFRLYPGSPIDADRGYYERTFGTRFHRTQWWEDGDPEFLSEWVDPSAELTYLQREAMQAELLTPVLAQIEEKFVYRGSAGEYFRRAIRDQVAFANARNRLPSLERWYAWQRYLGRGEEARGQRRTHLALTEVARTLRASVLPEVCRIASADPDGPIAHALAITPRERFVPLDAIAHSVEDTAVALDPDALSTVSAMHAYARIFVLLEVEAGDRVLDLGSGSGYGCALLRAIVGDTGEVAGIEVDPALVSLANAELDPPSPCVVADALAPSTWPESLRAFPKIAVGFALPSVPAAWAEMLREGTVIVAPVRDEGGTLRLTRLELQAGVFGRETFEAVAFVAARRPEDIVPKPAPTADTDGARGARARLPVVR